MQGKYAIIRINGRQYRVEEGEELLIDKTEKPEAEVLLFADSNKITIGEPIVKGAKVSIKVLGEAKGDKVEVLKYKSKSRYRRHLGFRPKYTRVIIEKLA